jgi:hypothetical protein
MTVGPGLMILIAGAVCAALVAVDAAPDTIERARILVTGNGGQAAIAALAAAVQRASDPSAAVTTQVDSVTIARRSPANASVGSTAVYALAERAVAGVTAAASTVLPSPLPALAVYAAMAALEVQRGSAEAAQQEADRRITGLYAALTDIARDTAAAQRPDTMPDADTVDAPVRAMLTTVQLRRLDLAARYTADFPGIAIADGEIARLQTLLAYAARRQQPHTQAALATLHGEQVRVQTALDSETRRRDRLSNQLTRLDAAIAAQLAGSAATAPLPMPAVTHYTIVALPLTVLPDPRPASGAAIITVSVAAAWLARRRTRPADRMQAQIALIELQLHLPVLCCLDTNGTPLPLGRSGADGASGQIWL